MLQHIKFKKKFSKCEVLNTGILTVNLNNWLGQKFGCPVIIKRKLVHFTVLKNAVLNLKSVGLSLVANIFLGRLVLSKGGQI